MPSAVHTASSLTDTQRLADEVGRRVAAAGLADGPLALVASAERAVGAAAWLLQTRREGLIVGPERWTGAVWGEALRRGFAALDLQDGQTWRPDARATAIAGRIWLLTSGTTGAPKWVAHTWDSLSTVPQSATLPPRRWLLTYQAGTYAWTQVVVLALRHAGQSLVVPASSDPAEQLALAARAGADAVSSTPTFWRMALLTAGEATARALPLRQVSLGGERVDQAILDRLAKLWPQARITHIYAATEVGAAIVVHDGKAGFPASWLERQPTPGEDRPLLRVQDGRLWVRSSKAGEGLRDWQDTGDAVVEAARRIEVIGRAAGSLVKVGGASVDLRQVEAAVLLLPSVLWCRVRARAAPVVGNLLQAEVVLRPGETAAPDALRAELAGRLPDYMVPRFWRIVDHIPATGNFKTELRP